MKRNRFTDEQIIGILKEHEAGTPVSELCRKRGVSDASIYKWKAKFGGMDVSQVRYFSRGASSGDRPADRIYDPQTRHLLHNVPLAYHFP